MKFPRSPRLLSVIVLAGFLFLFAPLLVIVLYSFNASGSTIVWGGFSLDWYGVALDNRNLKRSLAVSLTTAVPAALIATIVGTLAALAVSRRRFPGKAAFSTMLVAPLVLPEIVLAVGIMMAATRTGVQFGYTTMIAGHVLVTVPFSFLIVRAAAANLDPDIDEAAADLGAHSLQIFRRITLPLLAPAILASFLLSIVLSFSNFIVSTFVSGVGTTPLPIQIYSMLKTGLTPEVNALGAMLMLGIGAVVVVASRQYTRSLKSPNR
jgi:ABC-type spermidine/putrescine transport system permease subunit II